MTSEDIKHQLNKAGRTVRCAGRTRAIVVTPVAPFALGMGRVRIATSLRCADASLCTVCLFGLPSGRGPGGAPSISSTSSLPASQAVWGCRTRGQGFALVSFRFSVGLSPQKPPGLLRGVPRVLTQLQVLTSTYKLNLPSKALRVLILRLGPYKSS